MTAKQRLWPSFITHLWGWYWNVCNISVQCAAALHLDVACLREVEKHEEHRFHMQVPYDLLLLDTCIRSS